MSSGSHPTWARDLQCEVLSDNLTRTLYATDASVYQITPAAVAFPRSAAEACEVIQAAAGAGLSIIPRGAGTGLAGGALGDGLVIDFARHNRGIGALDTDCRTIRVGAGVILDQLNDFVRPHGLRFGPDVATSSRATLGGMIANDSSGANVPAYGTTGEHVLSVEMVLADGAVLETTAGASTLADLRSRLNRLVDRHESDIQHRFPGGLLKRWHGYGLDRYRRDRGALMHIISGSEGTLAGIFSATLRLVPLPTSKGLAVICFASVSDAMQAAVDLRDLMPAAIEHVDHILFDQTRGRREFKSARAMLELDASPCESMLFVEFFNNDDDGLAALSKRNLGLRTVLCRSDDEMERVWAVRRTGLSLLTGCKGPAKPTGGIEDVAVRPDQLPEYVRDLRGILDAVGVDASFYGHAAAGLLHVRPVLDLHSHQDVVRYREIAKEVSALTRRFKGSIAAEHGVGIARTEFLKDHLGPVLTEAHRAIKAMFDPRGIMNPGKIVDDGRYRIDTNLRQGGGHEISLPFEPLIRFSHRDESFVGHLEQCNGCGGCVKQTPAMCPTYLATGDERFSTRGRANVIRAALEGRSGARTGALCSPELHAVLDECLSCKACKDECPSEVDLSLLKAELLHARHKLLGTPFRDRLISAADSLGRIGCALSPVANATFKARPLRRILERMLGFNADRALPGFARQRFDHWFARRHPPSALNRGCVVLWDDTWTRYYTPHVGRAAVRVLEAAGYEVRLVRGRSCCGRPAFSRGLLDEAARMGRENLSLLRAENNSPILFLEPSCYSMFASDYRELGLPGAESVASRCVLFESFVEELLARAPDALGFEGRLRRVAVHIHCHAKTITEPAVLQRLIGHVPVASAQILDSGCCGMAGAFGLLNYDLSLKVAGPLIEMIEALPAGTQVVASGTSCRQQITHLSGARPIHAAEFLADSLATE